MKRYLDIQRLKDEHLNWFKEGDEIVIEEKIDFSNASFRYDKETDAIQAFSRNKELDEVNNLNGFWNWVQTLNKEKVESVLKGRYIVFGEWAGITHAVQYPAEVMKKLWVFDVYDTKNEEYISYNEAYKIFKELELENFVPVFYIGKFISWEHVISFIGKTRLGGEFGEGIVLKKQSTNTYIKIVSDKFSEVHRKPKVKIINESIRNKILQDQQTVSSIVTKNRVQKIIYKMIDEGELDENWGKENLKDICKTLPKLVFNDCLKEEKEVVRDVENFGKLSAKITMEIVREIVQEK